MANEADFKYMFVIIASLAVGALLLLVFFFFPYIYISEFFFFETQIDEVLGCREMKRSVVLFCRLIPVAFFLKMAL